MCIHAFRGIGDWAHILQERGWVEVVEVESKRNEEEN